MLSEILFKIHGSQMATVRMFDFIYEVSYLKFWTQNWRIFVRLDLCLNSVKVTDCERKVTVILCDG